MLLTAILLAVATRAAAADPISLHMRGSFSVKMDDTGTALHLPPGYYIDEPTHDKLDTETKRLQDAETRLTAENKSMRASLDGWSPGFYTLVTSIAGGIVLGWYLHDKI